MFERIINFFAKFRTIERIDHLSSMELLGRDEYKYIEGERALTVQIEMLSGNPQRIIYSKTIKKWMPPHENDNITDEKRREIVAKICKYFENNKISYTVK